MSAAPPRVLVVDDEPAVRSALRVNLARAGYEVVLAGTAEEALKALAERPVDLVLTDVKMPGAGGMALLEQLNRSSPDMPVVMMTGHGRVEDAVAAMKAGASDYIIKPISKDELLVILDRSLKARALQAEVVELRAEVARRYSFENLVGGTPSMQKVYALVAAVADSGALVLLTGATGTGKELLAHAIHYRSSRRPGPFVRVNCAALPEGLLESELFGHEKGAFTGAIRQHRGRFEQADGGTLLLDEIGEIPLSVQVKLLRVLESGEIQRVGGSDTIRVDVRVVAATNRDLRKEVKAGRFREDLYYRLNVFHIQLPPLRDRVDDIPLLVEHFVEKYAERYHKTVRRVRPEIMALLLRHSWPGNVRELQHVIERGVLLSTGEELEQVILNDGEEIEPEPTADVPEGPDEVPEGRSLADVMEEQERRLIVDALRKEKGVQARAARRLGISRSNLNYRIQRLSIEVKDVLYD